MSCRVVRSLLVLAIAIAVGGVSLNARAQDAGPVSVDFAALALRPGDVAAPGWRHEGAFMEDIRSEAEIVAGYRGTITADEVEQQLVSFGWRGIYVNLLSLSADGAAAPAQRIRSYITEFDSADGAAAAFAFLEDEGADSSAEDIPTTRPFGEQSELTSEQGISGIDGRPFRSLDLTFRVGGITAGVALVIYRAGDAETADLATIEALAAVVEARLLEPAVDGGGLGMGVVRFVEGGPRVVATYDDAYYRIAGVDVPLVGEADASAALRTAAYADAIDVYQLWQGLDVGSADGALYGVTALRFADDAAAAAWLGSLEATLGENPFYGDLRRVETDVAAGEAVALSYVSGGRSPDSPRAMLVAIRVGQVVARVHLVPQGGLNDVAPADARALADLAAGCLARGDCPVLTSLPTDPAPGAEATPELDEDR